MQLPTTILIALRLLALSYCWPLQTGLAQTAGQYSLADCIGYATENSFTLKLARLDEKIASAYVREVRSTGLPQVSVSSTFEDNLRLPVSLIPAEVTDGEPGTFGWNWANSATPTTTSWTAKEPPS